MDYQVKRFCWQYKLFCWQNNGSCLIIIARGDMDKTGFLRIFREIVEVTKPLKGCKVLLDFQDSNCDFGPDDLADIHDELTNHPSAAFSNLKLAMVTIRLPEQFDRLRLLIAPLSQLGIDVSVFYEEKSGIDWLAEETRQR
jgi:hypothetical protein